MSSVFPLGRLASKKAAESTSPSAAPALNERSGTSNSIPTEPPKSSTVSPSIDAATLQRGTRLWEEEIPNPYPPTHRCHGKEIVPYPNFAPGEIDGQGGLNAVKVLAGDACYLPASPARVDTEEDIERIQALLSTVPTGPDQIPMLYNAQTNLLFMPAGEDGLVVAQVDLKLLASAGAPKTVLGDMLREAVSSGNGPVTFAVPIQSLQGSWFVYPDTLSHFNDRSQAVDLFLEPNVRLQVQFEQRAMEGEKMARYATAYNQSWEIFASAAPGNTGPRGQPIHGRRVPKIGGSLDGLPRHGRRSKSNEGRRTGRVSSLSARPTRNDIRTRQSALEWIRAGVRRANRVPNEALLNQRIALSGFGNPQHRGPVSLGVEANAPRGVAENFRIGELHVQRLEDPATRAQYKSYHDGSGDPANFRFWVKTQTGWREATKDELQKEFDRFQLEKRPFNLSTRPMSFAPVKTTARWDEFIERKFQWQDGKETRSLTLVFPPPTAGEYVPTITGHAAHIVALLPPRILRQINRIEWRMLENTDYQGYCIPGAKGGKILIVNLPRAEGESAGVLFHEIGHIVEGGRPDAHNAMLLAAALENKPLGEEYAKSHKREQAAEAFREYVVIGPENFYKEHPLRARVVEGMASGQIGGLSRAERVELAHKVMLAGGITALATGLAMLLYLLCEEE